MSAQQQLRELLKEKQVAPQHDARKQRHASHS